MNEQFYWIFWILLNEYFFEWIFRISFWIEFWIESYLGQIQWKNEFSKRIAQGYSLHCEEKVEEGDLVQLLLLSPPSSDRTEVSSRPPLLFPTRSWAKAGDEQEHCPPCWLGQKVFRSKQQQKETAEGSNVQSLATAWLRWFTIHWFIAQFDGLHNYNVLPIQQRERRSPTHTG